MDQQLLDLIAELKSEGYTIGDVINAWDALASGAHTNTDPPVIPVPPPPPPGPKPK